MNTYTFLKVSRLYETYVRVEWDNLEAYHEELLYIYEQLFKHSSYDNDTNEFDCLTEFFIENKTKLADRCDMSQHKLSLAMVTWNHHDIKMIHPTWSPQVCNSYLSEIASDIEDAMIEAAWGVINANLEDFAEREYFKSHPELNP